MWERYQVAGSPALWPAGGHVESDPIRSLSSEKTVTISTIRAELLGESEAGVRETYARICEAGELINVSRGDKVGRAGKRERGLRTVGLQ